MSKPNENLVFVDNKVIGEIRAGVFVQRTTERHIFRELNAKGMDVDVHGRLAGRCDAWRLEFKDTGQILTIPFAKIAQVGILRSTGAGAQYLVKLSEFNEDRPVIQHALPGLLEGKR